MCILLFGINRNSPGNFRSLARIFLLPLELQSWAVREAITGVAQLRSSKGRRKIRARDLKLLGELRFIPNRKMRIEPKNLPKISLALLRVYLKCLSQGMKSPLDPSWGEKFSCYKVWRSPTFWRPLLKGSNLSLHFLTLQNTAVFFSPWRVWRAIYALGSKFLVKSTLLNTPFGISF